MTHEPIARRAFVCACAARAAALGAATLGTAALGACASLVTREIAAIDGRLELALAQYPELMERGGSLRILPLGERDPVYVLAQDDGTFAALSPICTHLGCTVEIQGQWLACPCHGSMYDRRGAVLQGPAQRSLEHFSTRVSADGVLIIDLRSRA